MNKLNIILVVLVSLCGFIINCVLADDSDCRIFGAAPYKQDAGQNGFGSVSQVWETAKYQYTDFLSIEQQKNIITKADLNTAILNLKKYCCVNNLWWLSQNLKTCDDDKSFFNENALDSQYLFDHIFDVMMRRLAWLTWDTNVYSDMTVDDAWDYSWKRWREYIVSKAEDLSWSDSQTIIDEYRKFWVWSEPSFWYDIRWKISWIFGGGGVSDNRFLEYVSWKSWEESEKVAKAIKDYDKWTLYDRYRNVCDLAKYFYVLLGGSPSSVDGAQIINRGWSCEDFVDSQIEKETDYVNLVVQRSSNLFMKNYMSWYFKYLKDRWDKLRTLWKDSVDRWLDVVRAVPYLSNRCVK